MTFSMSMLDVHVITIKINEIFNKYFKLQTFSRNVTDATGCYGRYILAVMGLVFPEYGGFLWTLHM